MDISVADAWDIRLHGYFSFFSIAFLYYDHLITIDREIKYIWRRPKTPSAYMFLANRYFSFSANIVVAVFQVTNFNHLQVRTIPALLNTSLNSLSRGSRFFSMLESVSQIAPPKLQELQSVTAASPCDKSNLSTCSNDLAGIRSVWMLVPGLRKHAHSGGGVAGVAGWTLFGQKTKVAQKLSGCHIGISHDTSTRLAAAWVALFAYDSIVFVLTLVKTWQAGRKIQIRPRLPIVALLLRDGSIYFAVMALANLANILTFYFCGPFLRGGLSTFAGSISVTMISRFMLNLHETATIGIFSTHIGTLGPMPRAECLDESLAISELLPRTQESIGGAEPPENSTR
ncbi:hypothetical protein BD779DRAFT_1804908 [Infundibulicybe gibba]|nr:hypothetical protein BD779DRAFT_1804908 [Infundibulicybe gibba]